MLTIEMEDGFKVPCKPSMHRRILGLSPVNAWKSLLLNKNSKNGTIIKEIESF